MAKHFNTIKTNKSNDENSFHLAIAPILAIARIFSILPITGIFSKDVENIKFKLISFRTLHTVLWFCSSIVFFYLELLRLSHIEKLNAKSIDGIMFYCLGISSSLVFIRIATKWNDLLFLFKEIDEIFSSSPYTSSGWSLKKRLKYTAGIMLTCALLEHLFSWYSYLNDRFIQADVCNWEIDSWFFYITSLHLSHVYNLFPVNIFSVFWAEYMNVSFTFTWNFIDLFIMMMSVSIASKFKMINERLAFFKGRIVADIFWDEIRSHYNKICELNEYVDDLLGSLICIACLSDLYYVCLQLLNVATPLPFIANKIYFWYSTMYLIFRTSALFLISSTVNDESLKPLAVFRTIPSDGWHHQVQRLCYQIQQNRVALSGKNFFFLTRGLVISIAGTIITYELVLLQFDGQKFLPGMFNPCGGMANNSGILKE